MQHKPRLQALVLAERIYTDQASQNKIICGTYNTLYVAKTGEDAAGATMLSGVDAWLYISITDIRTKPLVLEIRYIDMRDLGVLFSGSATVQTPSNPMETAEIVAQLPRLPIPHLGVYDLEVFAGDDLLGSHRVRVLQKPA